MAHRNLANSGASIASAADTVLSGQRAPHNTPAVSIAPSDSVTPRSAKPPYDPVALAGLIEEEHAINPGAFFESATPVPENTPVTTAVPSHAGDDTHSVRSPRSRFTPQKINLPAIDEKLENLPSPRNRTIFNATPESHVDQRTPIDLVRRAAQGASAANVSPGSGVTGPLQNPGILLRDLGATEVQHEGVVEHSDWSTYKHLNQRAKILLIAILDSDIEQDLARNLTRLANLAVDDEKRVPELTAETHYQRRLTAILTDENQRFLFGEAGPAPASATTQAAALSPLQGGISHENRDAQHEHAEPTVALVTQFVAPMADEHNTLTTGLNEVIQQIEHLKKQVVQLQDVAKAEGELVCDLRGQVQRLQDVVCRESNKNEERPVESHEPEVADTGERPEMMTADADA